MLAVDFSKASEKFSLRLPAKQKNQIGRRISALAGNPYASDTKEIRGFPLFRRADVCEYRIIYQVLGTILSIFLIGKRNDDEVYRRMKRLLA